MNERTDLIEKLIGESRYVEGRDDIQSLAFKEGCNTALSLNPWVETSDRLPSEAGEYLWYFRDNGEEYSVAFFSPQYARSQIQKWVTDYSHWQPLPPAPPQEGKCDHDVQPYVNPEEGSYTGIFRCVKCHEEINEPQENKQND